MYMEFAAFPLVFQDARGWPQASSGLAFICMGVGQILGMIYTSIDNKRYQRIVDKTANGHPPAETRLNPSLVGAVTLPIGLFLFAWTNSPNIHWIACEIGTVLLDLSHVVVFLSSANYLVDTYTLYAASTMAGNAVIRALFGAAFPLFCDPMYARLGIHWGSLVPAFLALACTPVPWLFYIYGPGICRHCKHAAESARRLDQILASTKQKEKEQEQEQGSQNNNGGSENASTLHPEKGSTNGDGDGKGSETASAKEKASTQEGCRDRNDDNHRLQYHDTIGIWFIGRTEKAHSNLCGQLGSTHV